MTIAFPVIGSQPWGANLNSVLAKLSSAPQPDDHGLIAWSFPPAARQGASNATAGVLHVTKVLLRAAGTITNLIAGVSTAGVGLTAGQNFGALYDSTGARVGVTADQTAVWNTTGAKTMALTVPYAAAAGFYWVAFLANASTSTPQFPRSVSDSSGLGNLGAAAATSWSATTGAALTTTPASFTPGTLTQNAFTFWAGIS